MIGFFGDIVFETSDQKILNFTDFNRDISSRWATHDVIRRKPASEFIGPNLDSISFTVNLNGNHGVKPLDEMNKWLVLCRNGRAETLVIGTRALGMDKWTVQSVSQAWNVIWSEGELFSGQVDIVLEEYLEVL